MFSKLNSFFILTFVLGISAQFADFVPQLTPRSARPAGGWSLSQGTCPTEAPQCGASWCCPSSTTCIHTGSSDIAEVCCSGSVDCLSAFQAGPFCADDTWSLWNSTTDTSDAFGYFCCLPGQVGMQNGDCVTPDLISASTQLAQELSPGGSATAGSGSSSSSSSSSTSGSSSTISSSSTTPTTATTSTTSATTSSAAAVTASSGIKTATPFSPSAPSTTSTPSSSIPSSTKPVISSPPSPTTTFAQASAGGLMVRPVGIWAFAQGMVAVVAAAMI